MEKKTTTVPFGMIFAEPATNAGIEQVPIYDETQQITLTKNHHGILTPLVELPITMLRTQTETRVVNESSDSDPKTETAGFFLRTQTQTEVQQEASDQDPDEDEYAAGCSINNSNLISSISHLATQTLTFIDNESSDTDENEDE